MRTFKVVLLGDFGVGKTSFGVRITEDRFEDTTKATIGVAHLTAYCMDSFFRRVCLELWDTAGQERYRSLDNMRMYLRNALAAFVLFDVTSNSTFESAKRVVEQLRSEDVGAAKQLVVALVANKCDISDHAVSQATLEAYAKKADVPVVALASCKSGQNIATLVRQVADRLMALPDDDQPDTSTGGAIIMPSSAPTNLSSRVSTSNACC